MHKYIESPTAPPIPPRRKKRKAKPAPTIKSLQDVSPAVLNKPDHKRMAPPPPPPPPRTARRRNKSRSVKNGQNQSSDQTAFEQLEEKLNFLSSTTISQPTSMQFGDTDLIPTKETRSNAYDSHERTSTADVSNQRSIYTVLAKKEANKYPPLFFTLSDFQNVMASSLQNEEEPARLPSIETGTSMYHHKDAFLDHSLDDEEENEVCFRVTTTNLPFGRCLDRWNDEFKNDHLVQKVDENSHFIFEDYIDRSNRLNIRRSTGPLCYDSVESDEPPAARSTTKVRFVIESPSSSTPEHEFNIDGEVTCDSLQNIDSLVHDQEEAERNCSTSAQTEDEADRANQNLSSEASFSNPDRFGDVPFSPVFDGENDAQAIGWSSMDTAPPSFDDDVSEVDVNFNESLCTKFSFELDEPFDFNSLWPAGRYTVADDESTEMSLIKSNMERAPDSGDSVDAVKSNAVRCSEGTSQNDDATSDAGSNCAEDNEQAGIEDGVWNVRESEDKTDLNGATEGSPEIETENVERKLTPADSIGKLTREEKRKIFLTESLRNCISNDEFQSMDSEGEANIEITEDSGKCNVPLGAESQSKNSTMESDETFEQLNTEDNAETTLVSRDKEARDLSSPTVSMEDESLARKTITVPVNVRRNSFLETMLSEDSQDAWRISSSCEIVATHPKTVLSTMLEEPVLTESNETELPNRLNNAIKMDLEIQKILKESEEATAVAPEKSTTGKKIGAKNAGEAKCDVLNELLSNFANIKLKPVARTSINESGSLPIARDVDHIVDAEESTTKNHEESQSNKPDDSIVDKGTEEPAENVNSDLHIIPGDNDAITVTSNENTADDETPVKNSNEVCPNPDNEVELQGELAIPEESEMIFQAETGLAKSEENSETAADCSGESLLKAEVAEPESLQEEHHGNSRISLGQTRAEGSSHVDSSDVYEASLASIEYVESREVEACSEKTDEKVREKDDDRGHEVGEDRGEAEGRSLGLKRTTGSADVCAIARRNPQPHCNNNDNNRAVTPVAVSDDQSRDIVTITPGRVRSFIKYYEIRREATVDQDSKINDRDYVDRDESTGHRSVSSIRRGLEAKTIQARSFDACKDNFEPPVVERGLGGSFKTRRKDVKRSTIAGNIRGSGEEDTLTKSNVDIEKKADEETTLDEDSTDSRGRPVKLGRKKSVKFQGGFTVIRSGSSYEDDSAGIRANQNVRSSRTKKSPDRPATNEAVLRPEVDCELAKPDESADTGSCSDVAVETAAQIHAEAEPEECSGINNFVPKPETPRLVFYCTV